MKVLILILFLASVALGSSCPTIELKGPAEIVEGDIPLYVWTSDTDVALTSNWTINGKTQIGVTSNSVSLDDTRGLGAKSIKVDLEIIGLPSGCESKFTFETKVKTGRGDHFCREFDQYSFQQRNQVLERTTLVTIELQARPSYVAEIVVVGNADDYRRIKSFAETEFEKRKTDKTRLNFSLIEVEEKFTTVEVWIFPPKSECLEDLRKRIRESTT